MQLPLHLCVVSSSQSTKAFAHLARGLQVNFPEIEVFRVDDARRDESVAGIYIYIIAGSQLRSPPKDKPRM